ncbi:phage filamentation protein Fil family protein [Enterobacter hormaechei]|nr:phage filamentation protein Fil family protein [Enterobacter hormaechei]MED5671899.1 phage filamentation protein Fil family protein [Enterobacter hormaechei]MED5677847.1 phage filamentation protein Fil family protein [Enterobacter hormaechei]
MKAFVTYLKKESPSRQLASGSTGWIELPNGQRWNPGHHYKFNARSSRRPWWFGLFRIIRGRHGH